MGITITITMFSLTLALFALLKEFGCKVHASSNQPPLVSDDPLGVDVWWWWLLPCTKKAVKAAALSYNKASKAAAADNAMKESEAMPMLSYNRQLKMEEARLSYDRKMEEA